MKKTTPGNYASSGVNYKILDSIKRLAQSEAKKTAINLQNHQEMQEVSASRGESAYVWEEKDALRAIVIEGLGTKNVVADAMSKITNKSYYDSIAQDTVACIVNDLLVVGADPQIMTAYWAVGSSDWFSNKMRAEDLIHGWKMACDMAGVTWGGGETPTLKGVVAEDTIDLGGSAVGIISPKEKLVLGDKLVAGDAILLVESSGIHANGLSLARSVAEQLPDGYATPLLNGKSYGETILTPTFIYAKLVKSLQEKDLEIHYMVHITGHGWRKLMRAEKALSYIVEKIPQPQEIFTFIQEKSHSSDEEMYGNFNMGAGFAIFVSQKDVKKVIAIGKKNNLTILQAGLVVEGEKKVVIKPKNITFTADMLQVRS
ncbi:MAG TPA: AIR synthase-related protein [Candidatus Saccharimonadales bacterium]|nr:AIR synthase-related protein [Candidatus Saccharimonadales bacterium]